MINYQNKYIFIFAISVFFILSISGAGIFLNDEWMTAQELNQLGQGHQISYNEGKYGYYANGTIGEYMQIRDNRLIYSIALPLVSLPIHYLFAALSIDTRLFIIAIWGLLGIYCFYYIRKRLFPDHKSYDMLAFLFTLFVLYNGYISTPFIMTGKYIPNEILSIAFTNILIFGIFSVLCYKVSELLFKDSIKSLIGWISCIGLSSLIFWCTTLKDHMIIAMLMMVIYYIYIQYQREEKYYLLFILSGIITWIRPEIGIFILIAIIIVQLINLTTYKDFPLKQISISSISIVIGLLPLFMNNILSTGSFYKNAFLMSNYNTTGGNIPTYASGIIPQILHTQLEISSPGSWLKLFVIPTSGAVGLIVPLIIFFFGILIWIKHRPKLSSEIKFMIFISLASVSYYLLISGAYLGMDTGIIPDIRYMSIMYAPLTLCGLYIIFNSYPSLNYRKMFKNIFIYSSIVLIISLFLMALLPQVGETYRTFRLVPTAFSLVSFAVMTILLVNDGNSKPILLERVIPFAIASCISWQVIITFVYHLSKANYYPMFIPMSEIIFKLLFGG